MEEEQKQNPKDDSDLPNQSGNDGGQTSESSDEDENVKKYFLLKKRNLLISCSFKDL